MRVQIWDIIDKGFDQFHTLIFSGAWDTWDLDAPQLSYIASSDSPAVGSFSYFCIQRPRALHTIIKTQILSMTRFAKIDMNTMPLHFINRLELGSSATELAGMWLMMSLELAHSIKVSNLVRIMSSEVAVTRGTSLTKPHFLPASPAL